MSSRLSPSTTMLLLLLLALSSALSQLSWTPLLPSLHPASVSPLSTLSAPMAMLLSLQSFPWQVLVLSSLLALSTSATTTLSSCFSGMNAAFKSLLLEWKSPAAGASDLVCGAVVVVDVVVLTTLTLLSMLAPFFSIIRICLFSLLLSHSRPLPLLICKLFSDYTTDRRNHFFAVRRIIIIESRTKLTRLHLWFRHALLYLITQFQLSGWCCLMTALLPNNIYFLCIFSVSNKMVIICVRFE